MPPLPLAAFVGHRTGASTNLATHGPGVPGATSAGGASYLTPPAATSDATDSLPVAVTTASSF
jgi:hypothetical protein